MHFLLLVYGEEYYNLCYNIFDAKSGSYIVQDIFECIYLKSRYVLMYPILLCRGHKFESNDKLKFYYNL